ncbi:hypothetical protein [Luteolibacter luteus]|uniref:Uncharacterized protein n=1 Tax=Luteolibacter luteus TaxID=2728835 RepID=A0A858RGC3_9BACT|nr:hypothetical protein [Luteolibacter luteus]QJE95604.1 hypothetical protein HHL09_07315 [Luteolibacter luteus]
MRTITALLLMAGPLSAYTLHEWGTFTTVAGSDGVLLEGLDREEAPLPRFTYSHAGLENGNIPRIDGRPVKGFMRRPLSGVTVKMETPVIYFHSDKAFDVKVKVGFSGGTISQWYPDRSGGEKLPPLPPLPDNPTPADHAKRVLDFSKPYSGSIEWQARVLSPEESRNAILFRPGETLHWMRPRVPEANAVRTAKGETEGFLFYRGIGNFDPGLRTTVSSDETLHLENRSGGQIPFAFVFEREGLTTRWSLVKGGLAERGKAEVPKSTMSSSELTEEMIAAGIWETPFPEPVYREMVAGLTATGLLKSEATAMVETWWESYFETEGLRVFWVLPESKTGAILPLEVSPAPEKQVRVLVGRSEVIRPRKEQEWLTLSRSKDPNHLANWDYTVKNDRFGRAYQLRVEALSATAAKTD